MYIYEDLIFHNKVKHLKALYGQIPIESVRYVFFLLFVVVYGLIHNCYGKKD